jgi:hypothetical protein
MHPKDYSQLYEVYNHEKKFYYELRKKVVSLRKKELRQSNFADGTYHITESGYYVLKENIIFNSESSNIAISIQTNNVCIDLNCFQIEQSREHALNEREFTIIELVSSCSCLQDSIRNSHCENSLLENDPILENSKIDWILIRNGSLGRTSQYGIKGSGNNYVVIEKMKIYDFEVAGIVLQGGHHILFRNVEIGPSRRDIPVNNLYKIARADLRLLDEYLVNHTIPSEQLIEINFKRQALEEELSLVLAEILETGKTTHPLFENPSGLPTSNLFGILIYPTNNSLDDLEDRTFNCSNLSNNSDNSTNCINSKYVYFKNVHVHNLEAQPEEIITLSQKDGNGAQLYPCGAVFQIERVLDKETGHYVGNTLSDFQIALGVLPIGENSLSQDLITWATTHTDIKTLLEIGYQYKCNSDAYFNLLIGISGVYLKEINYLFLCKLLVQYLINYSYLGNYICEHYYLSNDNQTRIGYTGANVVGVNFSRSEHLLSTPLIVSRLHSHNGEADGVRFINKTYNGIFKAIHVNNIVAGYEENESKWKGQSSDNQLVEYGEGLPNKIPSAIGIKIEDLCPHLKILKPDVRHLNAAGDIVSYWIR